MKLTDWMIQRYPFTWLGTFTWFFSLCLISLALIRQDVLALTVGIIGVVLPLLLFLIAHFLLASFRQDSLKWDGTPALRAGRRSRLLAVWEQPIRSRWVFRRHLLLTGSLNAGESCLYRYQRNLAFIKGRCEEDILLPASGQLKLQGRQALRDVLGLVSLDLGDRHDWEFTVLPRQVEVEFIMEDLLSENQQDQSRRKKEEIDKVFTREYMAGDLARDINWKAAARIGKLITRIPPESLGDSPLLQVYFRSPPPDRGMDSLFYLEYQKSLLLGFMDALKKGRGDHSFQIFLNRVEYMVSSDEEAAQFEAKLAQCGFSTSYSDYPLPQKGMESCIFSSVLDPVLKQELSTLDKESLQLFLCVPHTVENPGLRYTLFQEWPEFLPRKDWLKGGYPAMESYPRQLMGFYPFPLQGGWS